MFIVYALYKVKSYFVTVCACVNTRERYDKLQYVLEKYYVIEKRISELTLYLWIIAIDTTF